MSIFLFENFYREGKKRLYILAMLFQLLLQFQFRDGGSRSKVLQVSLFPSLWCFSRNLTFRFNSLLKQCRTKDYEIFNIFPSFWSVWQPRKQYIKSCPGIFKRLASCEKNKPSSIWGYEGKGHLEIWAEKKQWPKMSKGQHYVKSHDFHTKINSID